VFAWQRRQLSLLDRAPTFRALFLATTASGIGTWLAVIGLTVDVYDRTHSAKWVSALLIADFLPSVVIGLAFSPLVDRFSRWRLMVGSDLVSMLVFVALIFAGTPGQIVALATIAGFAAGFFRPASMAGLPNTVDDSDLPAANSLLRSTAYMTVIFGTLLGGIVVSAAGPHVSYAVNAVSFAVSALLLMTIPADSLDSKDDEHESAGYLAELKEGFALVFRSRVLLAVFISWNLVMLTNAGVNVGEIFLAKVSFGSGDIGYAMLWVGVGIGQVIGALYAATWLERRNVSFVYGASLALVSFGTLAAALSPDVWVAALAMVVGGAGNGTAIVCNTLLVQRGAPDRLRGRAFTTIMSVNFALLGVGMAVAGPLLDAVGARWVFAGAGILAAVAAVVGSAMTRRVGAMSDVSAAASSEPAPSPTS
jgi:MFS family permease